MPLTTIEIVEESATRNYRQIPEKEIYAVFADAAKWIESPAYKATQERRLNKVMEFSDRINRIVSPHSSCKNRCSHCCHMAVTICDQEAAKIQKATGIVPRKNVHQTLDRNAIVLQYVNTPCTFLKNGTCSIYEARPLACRLFWNISDYPHVCDTYNGHHNVPGLDMTPMHMLTVMIFAKSKFADIREFFPPNVE